MRKTTNTRGLVSLLAVALAPQVHAADGALEINQACVAEGCFPGDAPGFPVTLMTSGSYVLTSNLQVTAVDTGGIQIGSDHVVLDLAGFHIRGPVGCSGDPLNAGDPLICAPAATGGAGIDGNGITRGSQIRNGSISGFSRGIWGDRNSIITNVSASNNSVYGFALRPGAQIRDSTATRNGGPGFSGAYGTIVGCVASDNAGPGFELHGSVAERNSAFGNTAGGIHDHGRSRIAGNVVNENSGYGIRVVNGGSLIEGNRISRNGGWGLELSGEADLGAPAIPASLKDNALSNNNGSADGPQVGGPGSFILLGTNMCGTDTICP